MSFRREDKANSPISSEIDKLLAQYPQYAADITRAIEKINRQMIPLQAKDIRALLNNDVILRELLEASPNVENLIATLVNLNQADRLVPQNLTLLKRYPLLADLIGDAINEACNNLDADFNDEVPVFLNPIAEKALMNSFVSFNTAMERLESNNIPIKDYRDTLYRQVKDKDKVISMMIELNQTPGLLNPVNFRLLVQYEESNELPKLLKSFAPRELNQTKFNDVILKLNKGNLSRFRNEAEMKQEEFNRFRHTASQMKKKIPESLASQAEEDLPKKYKNIWYIKEIKDYKNTEEDMHRAQIEVVAQEFFRLLLPDSQMVNAALKNESFLAYVNSPIAELQFHQYVDYLSTFKTTGKNLIFDSPLHAKEDLQMQFNKLKTDALKVENPMTADASSESKSINDDELLQKLNTATPVTEPPDKRRRINS